MGALQAIVKRIVASQDKRTSRKLLAFVSDDWGCLRIRSKQDREALLKAGFNLDANRFDKFDSLETNEDIEHLFEVISRFRDSNGNHFVITAVSNMGNPDYEAISKSGFESYHYKTVVQSWNDQESSSRVYSLILDGIKSGIFIPEFHGREHLFVSYWMKLLKSNDPVVKKAFENGYYMLGKEALKSNYLYGLGAAFDYFDNSDLETRSQIIHDGLRIFNESFHYNSSYFTAPALIYNEGLNFDLHNSGIKWIDVSRNRRMPVGNGKYVRKFHHLGQMNKFNQRYVTRNCVFEPNHSNPENSVASCLKDIQIAFENKRPAIISNHRVAFVGGLYEKNRISGLNALELLLKSILSNWPDVEFCSVPALMNKLVECR